MAIDVTCECGKLLSVNDEFAGQRQQCPNCQKWLTLLKTPNRKTKQPANANHKSRKAETKDTRAALRHSDVPLGITWVYYGFLLVILVGVLEIVVALASQRTVAQGEVSAASVLNVLTLAASFLAPFRVRV